MAYRGSFLPQALAVALGASVAAAQPLTYAEMLQTPLPLSHIGGSSAPEMTSSTGRDKLPTLWMEQLDLSSGGTRETPLTQEDYFCITHMSGNRNAEPPVKASCPKGTAAGENFLCLAECPVKLKALLDPKGKNCSKAIVTAYCQGDINCGQHGGPDGAPGCDVKPMFSPLCKAKMTSLISIMHPKAPPDAVEAAAGQVHQQSPPQLDFQGYIWRTLPVATAREGREGRRATTCARRTRRSLRGGVGAILSLSQSSSGLHDSLKCDSAHFGAHGHYYQCNSAGFHFWQAHYRCNGEKPPLGESCFGMNAYKELAMDLCVPDECSNPHDVSTMRFQFLRKTRPILGQF